MYLEISRKFTITRPVANAQGITSHLVVVKGGLELSFRSMGLGFAIWLFLAKIPIRAHPATIHRAIGLESVLTSHAVGKLSEGGYALSDLNLYWGCRPLIWLIKIASLFRRRNRSLLNHLPSYSGYRFYLHSPSGLFSL